MRERLRQRRSGTGEATFAATPINLTRLAERRYAATVISASKGRSKTAWDWYEQLGEIHYAVSRSSKVGGYADLGVYKVGANGEIEDQVTGGLEGEIADSLYSPYGGQRGLIERFLTLMKIPADSYLIADPNGDGYDFVSADELRFPDGTALDNTRTSRISRITLPSGTQWGSDRLEERVNPANFIGRVWRPSPRYVELPDSPMGPLDSTCEMLNLLTQGLRAKLLSRLASVGILYIPSEVNDALSAAPQGDDGVFHEHKVINEFLKASTYAARNPGDPEAAQPILFSGPGEQAANLRHIIMDQEIFKTDMEQRAELISRILVGLDIQPAQVKGVDQSNHWSAWAASEDELRVAVRPDLEVMCWALTRLVLWKRLQEAGKPPGRIKNLVVGFDLSRAASHQNIAEDARQLWDRLALSDAAMREATGFEERHAPSEVERIRMIGVKIQNPYLATYGMSEAEKFDWEKINVSKTGPAADSQADPAKAQPGKGDPGSPNPSNRETKTPARLRPA